MPRAAPNFLILWNRRSGHQIGDPPPKLGALILLDKDLWSILQLTNVNTLHLLPLYILPCFNQADYESCYILGTCLLVTPSTFWLRLRDNGSLFSFVSGKVSFDSWKPIPCNILLVFEVLLASIFVVLQWANKATTWNQCKHGSLQ